MKLSASHFLITRLANQQRLMPIVWRAKWGGRFRSQSSETTGFQSSAYARNNKVMYKPLYPYILVAIFAILGTICVVISFAYGAYFHLFNAAISYAIGYALYHEDIKNK